MKFSLKQKTSQQLADKKAQIQVIGDAFFKEKNISGEFSVEYFIRYFSVLIEADMAIVVFAEDDNDQILGFICWIYYETPFTDETAAYASMYVSLEYRNSDIARKLLSMFIEENEWEVDCIRISHYGGEEERVGKLYKKVEFSPEYIVYRRML